MRYGFTLIELLAALAIASLALTLLFNSFFQTTRIVDRADDLISTSIRATVLQHQLEKDLMGSFIPVQAYKDEEKEKKDKKDEAKKAEKKEPKKEKKERKELTKVFYGVNKAQMLDILTFITNNPMSAYWSDKLGKARPKIARVVYRLVEDKERKESYTLFRQEDYNLEFEAYALGSTKEIRSYEVVDGIKELSAEYTVMIEEEEEKEKKDEKAEPKKAEPSKKEEKPKKKKKITFKKFPEWNMEKEEQIPKDIKRRIPNVVEIKAVLWDTKCVTTFPFTFSIPIIPDVSIKLREKSEDKKTDQAKTQPTGSQKSTPRNAGTSSSDSTAMSSPLMNIFRPRGQQV